NANAHPKHNTFEWSIKAGISVADYARKRRFPMTVHADPTGMAPPRGPLTWDALMQYTARLDARQDAGLGDVLSAGGFRQFVAVMVSFPDETLITPLIGLSNSGARVLVVVPDPATFPGKGGIDGTRFVDTLVAEGVDAVRLPYGDDWAATLTTHVRPNPVGLR
ncbi:MAG: hypothetical protein AAF125_20305, partial [Chloroflexota bacterium]